MPTPFITVRSQAQALATVTQAQLATVLAPPTPPTSTPLTTLKYTDNSNDTNIIEVPDAVGGSLYDIVASFHFSGLTAGSFATIRSVYWDKINNQRATVMATTIQGTSTGFVQGQHSAHAKLDGIPYRTPGNTRLVIEAGASISGVTLSYWRVDGYRW